MSEAKTGRPKRREIDRLRTIVWVSAVMHAGGYSSGYHLETSLEPDEDLGDGVQRPKKWDKYLTGKAVPQRITGKSYAVEVAERRHPGTARFFNSPIWPILAGKRPDEALIERSLLALGKPIVDVLYFPLEFRFPWERRPRPFTRESIEALIELGTFSTIEAAVLLYAKAEAITSQDLAERAFDLGFDMRPTVETLPMVAPIAADLFTAIAGRCKLWIYVNNQLRYPAQVFHGDLADDAQQHPPVARERRLGLIGETTPKTRIDGGDDKSYFDT